MMNLASVARSLRLAFARPTQSVLDQGGGEERPKGASMWTDTATSQLVELMSRIPETDELLTQAGITRQALKKLETDDEIFAALRTRREAVVATPWRLEGGDARVSEIVTRELTPLMERVVAGAWRAVPYGYSVMEAVYIMRPDGSVGLVDIAQKPLEWFDPRPDGSLRYFSPDGAAANGEVLDQTFKFFLTRSDPTYQQPKGEALLSRLYWPWFFRFNGWKFWGQFLERYGQPLLVGKSNDTEAMLAALLATYQDAVIAVGPNDEVDSIDPKTNGEAFEKIEQCIVRRYQKLILGQTLTSDTGTSGGGSLALGQVHADVKEGLRRADIRLVMQTVQRVILGLCLLNGVSDTPEVVFADDAGLEKERSERDRNLYMLGVRFKENYFLERYDLRDDDFEVVEQITTVPVEEGGQGAAIENAEQQNAQASRDLLNAMQSTAFARRRKRDPRRFTPAQQAVEDTADAALSLCGQPVDADKVRAAVLAARNPGDLADRLAVLLGTSQSDQFVASLERAMFVANVIGFANSDGKV